MNENDAMLSKLFEEIENHSKKHELSKNLPDDWYEPGMMEYLDKYVGEYDYDGESGTAVIQTEVKGLRYEGRTPRLDKLKIGDEVNIVRDPDNKFNSNNFLVTGPEGENLGTLSAQLCNALAPVYDSGTVRITGAEICYIERIRDRSRYAKQGVLFIKIEFVLQIP